ncbi:hypothetical protein [Embleya sp. NBC_00896]|uniref:hypothetical protein n=1 Tax=Embleya sp. NBC_00896 TaxID=2975961 RepID=UPI0038694081|nr:hypothetical protein OG928_18080 [Embleya sp. NBC_00896]
MAAIVSRADGRRKAPRRKPVPRSASRNGRPPAVAGTDRAKHPPVLGREVRRSARELFTTGTYTGLTDAIDYGELNALLRD